jgi:phytoene synthase
MASKAALEDYAVRTAAAVLRLAAQILNDGMAVDAEAAYRHAGVALTIAALLQRLPRHSARGQRYLPDDLSSLHQADAGDLHAGRASAAWQRVVADLLALARSHLVALQTAGDGIAERLLPAFLPVSTVPSALARLERGGPLSPEVLPHWRRQWILWRAARDPRRFIKVAANR